MLDTTTTKYEHYITAYLTTVNICLLIVILVLDTTTTKYEHYITAYLTTVNICLLIVILVLDTTTKNIPLALLTNVNIDLCKITPLYKALKPIAKFSF